MQHFIRRRGHTELIGRARRPRSAHRRATSAARSATPCRAGRRDQCGQHEQKVDGAIRDVLREQETTHQQGAADQQVTPPPLRSARIRAARAAPAPPRRRASRPEEHLQRHGTRSRQTNHRSKVERQTVCTEHVVIERPRHGYVRNAAQNGAAIQANHTAITPSAIAPIARHTASLSRTASTSSTIG